MVLNIYKMDSGFYNLYIMFVTFIVLMKIRWACK